MDRRNDICNAIEPKIEFCSLKKKEEKKNTKTNELIK